jgi:hypothetical protein
VRQERGIGGAAVENLRRERVIWSFLVLTRVQEEKKEGAASPPAKAADPVRIPIDWSGKISSSTVPEGTYQVEIEDELAKAGVDMTKTMLAEDMEKKRADLGQVEVRVGEKTTFNVKAP